MSFEDGCSGIEVETRKRLDVVTTRDVEVGPRYTVVVFTQLLDKEAQWKVRWLGERSKLGKDCGVHVPAGEGGPKCDVLIEGLVGYIEADLVRGVGKVRIDRRRSVRFARAGNEAEGNAPWGLKNAVAGSRYDGRAEGRRTLGPPADVIDDKVEVCRCGAIVDSLQFKMHVAGIWEQMYELIVIWIDLAQCRRRGRRPIARASSKLAAGILRTAFSH